MPHLNHPGHCREQVNGTPALDHVVAGNGLAVHDELALALTCAHKADMEAQPELHKVEGAWPHKESTGREHLNVVWGSWVSQT